MIEFMIGLVTGILVGGIFAITAMSIFIVGRDKEE